MALRIEDDTRRASFRAEFKAWLRKAVKGLEGKEPGAGAGIILEHLRKVEGKVAESHASGTR